MQIVIVSTIKLFIAAIILGLIAKFPGDRPPLKEPFFAGQKWTLTDAYKVLAPMCIMLWVTLVLSQIVPYPGPSWQLKLQLITSSIWCIAVYALFHFIIFKRYRMDVTVLGLDKAKFLRAAILAMNIVIILFLFSLLLKIDSPAVISIAVDYSKSEMSVFLLLTFIIVFISPVLEELLWRGILYAPVARKVGPWQAAALLSLAEGLLHFQGYLPHTIGHFLSSLLCYYVYKRGKSLYAPIIIHIGYNFCGSRLVIEKALASHFDSRVLDKYYIYAVVFCGIIVNALWLTKLFTKKLNSTGSTSTAVGRPRIDKSTNSPIVGRE